MIFSCTYKGCPRVTTRTQWDNPRERWFLNIPLTDDDGREINVSLCPMHAAEMLGLTEDFYVRTENAEKLIRGDIKLRNDSRGISSNSEN